MTANKRNKKESKIGKFTAWGACDENLILEVYDALEEIFSLLTQFGPIPSGLIFHLKGAYFEIRKIIIISKTLPYVNDAERCSNAKNYIKEHPDEFKYLTHEVVHEDWFCSSHGPRNALKGTYPYVAARYGYEINAHNAYVLMSAVMSKKPIPKIKFRYLK